MHYAARAEEIMRDRCRVGIPSAGRPTPEPVPLYYEYGTAIPCGVREPNAKELNDTALGLDMNDAVIRLPKGTVIQADYRIRVTERFGDLVSVDYAVTGVNITGLSCIVVYAKRVHGGSVL